MVIIYLTQSPNLPPCFYSVPACSVLSDWEEKSSSNKIVLQFYKTCLSHLSELPGARRHKQFLTGYLTFYNKKPFLDENSRGGFFYVLLGCRHKVNPQPLSPETVNGYGICRKRCWDIKYTNGIYRYLLTLLCQ